MMPQKYFTAIIIIIIILIINYYYTAVFISGIWVVSDKFAKKADLDELILYIDESGSGTLYIDSNETVIDKTISVITYPLPWYLFLPGKSSGYINISGTGGIWNNYLYYTLNLYRGELTLQSGDETYAILRKDYISEL